MCLLAQRSSFLRFLSRCSCSYGPLSILTDSLTSSISCLTPAFFWLSSHHKISRCCIFAQLLALAALCDPPATPASRHQSHGHGLSSQLYLPNRLPHSSRTQLLPYHCGPLQIPGNIFPQIFATFDSARQPCPTYMGKVTKPNHLYTNGRSLRVYVLFWLNCLQFRPPSCHTICVLYVCKRIASSGQAQWWKQLQRHGDNTPTHLSIWLRTPEGRLTKGSLPCLGHRLVDLPHRWDGGVPWHAKRATSSKVVLSTWHKPQIGRLGAGMVTTPSPFFVFVIFPRYDNADRAHNTHTVCIGKELLGTYSPKSLVFVVAGATAGRSATATLACTSSALLLFVVVSHHI